MLHLYQSNRLEHLAETMTHIQAVQPLQSPFAPEQIVVQSQGMRRFINQFLAKKQGISANIRFSLPAGLSWRLMRDTMPDIPELSPFSPEVMRWRLLALFSSPEFQSGEEFALAREALNTYLENGEYATYQLAGQLADVFDQYLVYRPNWIEAWQTGQLIDGLSPEQTWQAQLWRYLDDGRQSAPHRVQLWQALMHHLDNPPAWLPERFFVFGIATLAPMYLELLIRLAQHREVHIFALNPSSEYWGQVIEPAQILAQSDDPDLSLQGHPLLASLGKQGRDFFDALSEAQVQIDLNIYDDPNSDGRLLHTLQAHIQTQTLPDEAKGEWLAQHGLSTETALSYLQQDDRSIQIHSAHSPLRELQILKDQLLDLLNQNPSWQAHDIAVLTPHIEPYAPFIEAVFGQQTGGGQALPYSLSDVKLSRRQPLLYALEQTLSLLNSRFEVDKLLPLLDSETILRRFELTREDLPLLHDTIAKLNIHWGADKAQRSRFGDAHSLFTWQQGLDRLILGWLLPEPTAQSAKLWQNLSPWHTRPDHLETLSRFASLVRLLCQTRREWQTPTSIAQWAERVRVLIAELFDPSDEDKQAVQQLEQALADWLAESALADFEYSISQETAVQHINRFLSSQSDAGFLRGGITFCGMVPMRSLPFKVICLLGLNDGDFPRNTKASSFDLIAKHPKKGDRARRDDDRYLFLEALLSAREVLYLSFVGKNIRTDEACAPSTLLNELVDCIAEMTGISSKTLLDEWIIQHPLQAFSRQYFTDDNRLISSRSDYAQALNTPSAIVGDFFTPDADAPLPDAHHLIEQHDFIRFWRNPVKSYLRQVLNWQAPYLDNDWNASEPFEPVQTRLLSDAYVHARRTNQRFEDLAQELTAQSLLPAGALGELVQRDYAIQASALNSELLYSKALPERSGVFHSDMGQLNYRLSHDYEAGQILYAGQFLNERNQHGTLSSADKIELLLQHLIFCATTADDPDHPERKQTHFIQLPQTLTLPPIEQAQAQATLATWITVYQHGQTAPQPFFPRVNLATAQRLFTPKKNESGLNIEGALQAAAEKYHGGYQGFAQEDYPEVKLVYGRHADAEPPYRASEFLHLTEQLFAGLVDCLKALSGKGED